MTISNTRGWRTALSYLTMSAMLASTFTTPTSAYASTTPAQQSWGTLSQITGLSASEIQSYEQAGFSDQEIQTAVAVSKNSKTDLQAILGDLHKQIARADQIKVREDLNRIPADMQQRLIDRLKQQPEAKSVTNTSLTATSETDPTPEIPKVITSMDTAPYSVTISGANVSPLNGGVSLKETDMTLLGRGISFALTRTYNSDSAQFYDYDKSGVKASYLQSIYPLGAGWSWDIPSIQTDSNSKYLHLAGGGTYLISGMNIQGYPWKDLVLSNETSTINGETATTVLTSVKDGRKQYFSGDGRLLKIANAYGDFIQFKYGMVSGYTKKLLTEISSSIADPVRNTGKISIQYNAGVSVTLTQGWQTVVYTKKVVQDTLPTEKLESVTDSAGRVTKYRYRFSPAKYNMESTTPQVDNPYALLEIMTHPTGAQTLFTYDEFPITRYTGEKSVNQAYRVLSFKNVVSYMDGTSKSYNMYDFNYGSVDLASSYNTDLILETVMSNSISKTKFEYKKDYVDSTVGSVFYQTKTTQTDIASSVSTVINNTYDEIKHLTVPSKSTKQAINGSTVSVGATTTKEYDVFGNVLKETDPLGSVTSYGYDEKGRLVNKEQLVTDLQKIKTNYKRNLQGDIVEERLTDEKNELVRWNVYEYDSYGNISRSLSSGDSNDSTTYQYSTASPYYGAFLTGISKTTKDKNGLLVTSQQSYNYEVSLGKLSSSTDGNQNTSSYTYDTLGRLVLLTNPDGSTRTLTYDDLNNNVVIKNEVGLISRVSWNPMGLDKVTEVYINGKYQQMAKTTNDNLGRLSTSEDANKNVTQTEYDGFDRQVKVTYPSQPDHLVSSSMSYDDIQNMLTTIGPDQNVIREKHDVLGRMTSKEVVKSPQPLLLEQVTYDYLGKVRSHTNANKQTTNYNYDSLGQLISVIDAMGQETKYSYDGRGNQTQITYSDQQKVNKFYDEADRLIREVDTLNQEKKYEYDNNGNIKSVTDHNGNVISMKYNQNNQLIEKSMGAANVITYGYDRMGNRVSMTDSTGTTQYSYDSLGHLGQVNYPDQKRIAYSYDGNGNVISMTDPFGKTYNYAIDNLNRIQTVKMGSTSAIPEIQYAYNAGGTLATALQFNGMLTSYSYNEFNFVKSLVQKTKDNNVQNSYSYMYDQNNNQTSQNENNSTYNFTYDALDRIKTSGKNNETYTYDKRGNRTTQAADQLKLPSEATLEYDVWNQVKKVTTGDNKVVTYAYNGDGLMTERTENGVTTRYYYDGSNIIAEANVANGIATLVARYVRGNGGVLVAREDASGNKAYYQHNGHGDVTELRDVNGVMLNKYSYDIWGNPITVQETVSNPFRYTGEYWDATTNLVYLRARWYDPNIGQFIQEDSVDGKYQAPLSLNRYSYVLNNPLAYLDPTGHWCAVPGWAHPGPCTDAQNRKDGYESPDAYHVGDAIIHDYQQWDTYMPSDALNKMLEAAYYDSSRFFDSNGKCLDCVQEVAWGDDPVSAAILSIPMFEISLGAKAVGYPIANFEKHYAKHVIERGEFGNISRFEYVEKANTLLKRATHVGSRETRDKASVYFNEYTNEIAFVKDGVINSFFKVDYTKFTHLGINSALDYFYWALK